MNRYQKCLSVKVTKGLNWQWCWISIFINPLLKVGPGGHLVIWRLSISSTWFQPGCGGDQSSRRLACLQLRFSETILLNFFFFELLLDKICQQLDCSTSLRSSAFYQSSLLSIRTLLYPSLCWWSVDDQQQREQRSSGGQLTIGCICVKSKILHYTEFGP